MTIWLFKAENFKVLADSGIFFESQGTSRKGEYIVGVNAVSVNDLIIRLENAGLYDGDDYEIVQ